MLKPNEIEQIIYLIHSGFDINLLSFELDIPIEELKKYELQALSAKSIPSADESEKEEKQPAKNYDKIIERYKAEIYSNFQHSQTTRNLLAFAYFKAGKLDEARDELMSLIDESNSFLAYRQLVHLETTEGNYDDAKLWAYEAIDKFPNASSIREQLISIAKKENDNQEIINQLKEIIKLQPENEKVKTRLKQASHAEEEQR